MVEVLTRKEKSFEKKKKKKRNETKKKTRIYLLLERVTMAILLLVDRHDQGRKDIVGQTMSTTKLSTQIYKEFGFLQC